MPEPYAIIANCQSCGHTGGRRLAPDGDYVAAMEAARRKGVCSQCGRKVVPWMLWEPPEAAVDSERDRRLRRSQAEKDFKYLTCTKTKDTVRG